MDIGADELLGGQDPDGRGARQEAEELLRHILNVAPAPAATVVEEARKLGINGRTLRRAKQRLGVHTQRHGIPGGKPGEGYWTWELPHRDQDGQGGQRG